MGFLSVSGPSPYVQCHITINVLSTSLNKTFPSFLFCSHYAGSSNYVSFPSLCVRSQQDPYDHTQDATMFYNITENFMQSMKLDPNVKTSYEVTSIAKVYTFISLWTIENVYDYLIILNPTVSYQTYLLLLILITLKYEIEDYLRISNIQVMYF